MNLTEKRKDTIEQANHFIAQSKHQVNQQYRHQYHLMAPIGWINDPNGFIFFQGAYHLFYQYYPYDSQWGPMHWGHAKSTDMIHWEHLPVALAPDQWYDKDGCFSGSALEKDGLLYLMYTGHRIEEGKTYQTQCIATSKDGIHFEKLENNPVIGESILGKEGSIHDFRDPKVFVHGETYFAVVATKTEHDRGRILLFSSEDCINWQFYSVLLEGDASQGIMWECPDLFHLDGKDVLILSPIQIEKNGYEYHNISSTMACIGKMDWQTGKLEVETSHEIDFGLDFYAPQTTLGADNQRIMIAWMQMWARTLPTHVLGHRWAGSMTLPRTLHVRNGRLVQEPFAQIFDALNLQLNEEQIIVNEHPIVYRRVIEDNTYLRLVIQLNEAREFTFTLAGLQLSYSYDKEALTLSRENVGHVISGDEQPILTQRTIQTPLIEDCLTLEIFRDTSSIEVFISGQETITTTFYEEEKNKDLIFSATGNAIIQQLDIGQVIV